MARTDAVIVGADSRWPDGSLINKAGTYLLAWARARPGETVLRVQRAVQTASVDGGDPEWEPMDPGELGAPVWAGVTVANEYCDRTPAGLISAGFDEQGRGR